MEVGGWLVIRWGVGRRLPLKCHPQAPGQALNSPPELKKLNILTRTLFDGPETLRHFYFCVFLFLCSRGERIIWYSNIIRIVEAEY